MNTIRIIILNYNHTIKNADKGRSKLCMKKQKQTEKLAFITFKGKTRKHSEYTFRNFIPYKEVHKIVCNNAIFSLFSL